MRSKLEILRAYEICTRAREAGVAQDPQAHSALEGICDVLAWVLDRPDDGANENFRANLGRYEGWLAWHGYNSTPQ